MPSSKNIRPGVFFDFTKNQAARCLFDSSRRRMPPMRTPMWWYSPGSSLLTAVKQCIRKLFVLFLATPNSGVHTKKLIGLLQGNFAMDMCDILKLNGGHSRSVVVRRCNNYREVILDGSAPSNIFDNKLSKGVVLVIVHILSVVKNQRGQRIFAIFSGQDN